MYKPYRRLIQATVFAVMFLVPVLNALEIYAVTGTFYAINIGGLGIADPSVILQAIFASRELTIPLLSAAIFPLLVALLFGRMWCGWMCPYHLLADACAWIRAKVSRKIEPRPLIVAESFKANVCRFGFLILGTAAAGAIGIPVLNYVNAPGIVSTEAMILGKRKVRVRGICLYRHFAGAGAVCGSAFLVSIVLSYWFSGIVISYTVDSPGHVAGEKPQNALL